MGKEDVNSSDYQKQRCGTRSPQRDGRKQGKSDFRIRPMLPRQ